MDSAILIVTIIIMLILGVPVGICLASGILVLLLYDPVTSIGFIASKMYSGVAAFPLIALPFFMLAGVLMETGGLSKRLVAAADSLIGRMTGGLGMVTILACMFFGAISGVAVAVVAAIGSVMIPQMIKQGYSKVYATALVTVAGGLGVIVPPSYPLVLYGVVNNESVGSLFMAGIGPSTVVTLLLISFNYYFSRKYGYTGSGVPFSMKRVITTFWEAKWALLMPIIILGGIYGGIVTPTEAAVIAVVYGLIVSKYIYKENTWGKIIKMYKDNATFFAALMLTFAPAAALGPIFSYLGIPQAINEFILSISKNPYIVLAMIFLIMIPVGMFVQTNVIIIVLSPILLGVVKNLGVNPIHFGVFMVMCVCIAFVTPPAANSLFVASQISGISIDKIAKASIPFIIALSIATLLVAYFPITCFGLLKLLGIPY